jgi:peptidoglycan/xylan/chitin deacetylase (PgdA/CDA1 family)
MEHLELVENSKLNVFTINDLDELSHNNGVLLTFDDGGRSAMSISKKLDELGMKGHFFITTSMIGNKYFLNKEEIADIADRGHIIGSHSHTHPNVFKRLSKKEMLYEWTKSKEILEEVLGKEINSCSIPGGDADKKTYTTAIDVGYKYIFNSDPSLSPVKEGDTLIIGRICPKKGEKIEKIRDYLRFKNIQREFYKRMLKNNLKKILYPLYIYRRKKDKHFER